MEPHELICEDSKEDIGSLCYRKDIPPGYRRILVGTLDQMCPQDKDEWKGYQMFNGTLDIGVSCQRATYTRPPFPAFSIGTKHKVNPPPEEPDPPLPPLCSTLEKAKTDADKILCRVSDTPEGFDISADGKNFIRKCLEGFGFNFASKSCEKVNEDGTIEAYDNSAGALDVEYYYNVD